MFNGLRYLDSPINYALGFQDPATDWKYSIIDLHDNIVFYLIILSFLVSWFFISSLYSNDHLKYLHHGDLLEIIWTIIPAIILWIIGLPSLKLLYLMDDIINPDLSIKIIGYQWYWQYEYSDYSDQILTFDSFLIPESDLELGDLRQLTVDNNLILPVNTSIRLLITANDVIHSFAVPSLAIKCDAIPGRLNTIGLILNRTGFFWGQCSELCGFAHAFMPICIQSVTLPEYISFLQSNLSSVAPLR